jgi:glutathione S-transferase
MQGQANHFYRFTKERIPYPTQRYVGETERLYGILDAQLKDRDYIVGPGRGKYSIADIASIGWVNAALFAGIDMKLFPNLEKWLERVLARPAVQKGIYIPEPSKFTQSAYRERYKEDAEFKESEDKLMKALKDAKAQFNYKYSSP